MKWTVKKIAACKGHEKIIALTAYDTASARLVDEAGVQIILVGDSLGMTVLGYENTLPVTMDEMVHHTAAVVRGVSRALVVADMPFMSYQPSVERAMSNAGRFMKETGASAVKVEGGLERVAAVRALSESGIPVMGHIGMLPQHVKAYGGYPVQGKTEAAVESLVAAAQALEAAGAFALVIEAVPVETARRITASVNIPTIGIGAGPECDGQILVYHDLLGLGGEKVPRFVKTYIDTGALIRNAISNYGAEVREGTFPGPEHCYSGE